MKHIIPLSTFVIGTLLAGCSADKSEAVQTNVTPTGGKAYGSGPSAVTNPNIPAAAKQAIPGAK